jgi:hypothetical protein
MRIENRKSGLGTVTMVVRDRRRNMQWQQLALIESYAVAAEDWREQDVEVPKEPFASSLASAMIAPLKTSEHLGQILTDDA